VVPLNPESIAELACAHENAAGFEAAVLEVFERHIGCDVAFFCGPSEIGDAARGLDPRVRPRERWGEMSAECFYWSNWPAPRDYGRSDAWGAITLGRHAI
jgi:hypothetical protein